MQHPMLSSSSYVILGMVALYGPATAYEVKQCADSSVGYFWAFPRSQIYAEAARLVKLGLLAERREATGRRRRVYTIRATGRAVLTEWLRATTNTPTAIHDLGLLKLYFAQLGTRDDLIALAEQQARAHRQRLTEYQSIAEQIGGDPRAAFALATLQMGLRYEEHAVIFWEQLVHNPPSLAGDAAQGADH